MTPYAGTLSGDDAQAERRDEMAEVGRRSATGVTWVLIGWGSSKLLSFVTYLLLARFLTPADFGIVAFVMVAINALVSLQELGVPEAMIYRRDSNRAAGTALTINVGAALLLAGIVVLGSPHLARLGNNEQIAPVACVLALGLIVSSLGSVQRAMLEKELNFRRRIVADVIPLAGSGCLSIVLGLLGFGVWSLVAGFLLKCAASTLILWCISSVRPKPEFHAPLARKLLGYGSHVSVNTILQVFVPHLDFILVGYFLGVAALGLYSIAFTFANLVIAISHKISEVMFPAFSRLNHDRANLTHMLSDVFNLVWTATVPMCVILFICAPPFVTAYMGERWIGAIDALKALTLFGALRSLQIFGPAYKAVGRPDLQWKANVVRFAVSLPLMLYAVQYGIVGIAVSQVVTYLVILPLHGVFLDRMVGFTLHALWRCLWPALAGAGVMGLIIGVAYAIPELRDATSEPLGAVVLAGVALVGYVAVAVAINSRAIELCRTGMRMFMNRGLSRTGKHALGGVGAEG